MVKHGQKKTEMALGSPKPQHFFHPPRVQTVQPPLSDWAQIVGFGTPRLFTAQAGTINR